MKMLSSLLVALMGMVLLADATPIGAQKYPDRPIRLVVGFPPGGAADFLGRIAAQQLTDGLGQQAVVDNRGGAGGLIATEIAAKSLPDGYTLLFTSIPHVINPHLYRKANYDAIRDFTPVIQFVAVPLIKTLNSRGADAAGGTPEAFGKVIKADFAKWAKVVKESGARVD